MRIAIAGAGIAGLASALAFRKAGHDVVVVERTPSLATVGAGILVQANGLLALDALGVGDAVRAAGAPLAVLDLREHRGRLLLRMELASALPRRLRPVSVHRAELHTILWRACSAGGVSLRLGHEVVHVDMERAFPALACKTASGERRVVADLVVGADGVRSVVRETGRFEVEHDPVIEGSVQGVVPFSVADGSHGEYVGGGQACGLLPLGGARTFWFWGGSGTVVEALERTQYAHWKDRVGERFPVMQPVLGHHPDWSGLVRLTHRSLRCASWSRGRVVLIGDAAHAMSPNLGQGANCALVDALSLACHIAGSPSADSLSEELARFERERRPLVEAIQRRGRQDGVAGTQSWPGADLLLRTALRLSRFSSRARRRAEIRTIGGLEGDGIDLASAGVRLPLPWQA